MATTADYIQSTVDTTTVAPPRYKESIQIAIESSIVFIGMLSVVINPVTLLAMRRSKMVEKTSMNVLVTSLLCSDFFCGLSTMVFFTFGLVQDSMDTELVKYGRFFTAVVAVISFLSSSLNVGLITLDRVIATLFPFKYKTDSKLNRTKLIVAVMWLSTTVVMGLLAAMKSYSKGGVFYVTFPYQIIPDVFLEYISTPSLVGGLIVNVIMYIAIVACVRCTKQLKAKSLSEMQNRKVTATASIVVGMMLFSTVPIAVVTILGPNDDQVYLGSYEMLYEIALGLSIIPTFTNNFVYVSKLPECRKAFQKLFKTRNLTSVHPMTQSTDTKSEGRGRVQTVSATDDGIATSLA